MGRRRPAHTGPPLALEQGGRMPVGRPGSGSRPCRAESLGHPQMPRHRHSGRCVRCPDAAVPLGPGAGAAGSCAVPAVPVCPDDGRGPVAGPSAPRADDHGDLAQVRSAGEALGCPQQAGSPPHVAGRETAGGTAHCVPALLHQGVAPIGADGQGRAAARYRSFPACDHVHRGGHGTVELIRRNRRGRARVTLRARPDPNTARRAFVLAAFGARRVRIARGQGPVGPRSNTASPGRTRRRARRLRRVQGRYHCSLGDIGARTGRWRPGRPAETSRQSSIRRTSSILRTSL
ncbi:hypothetical protein SAMN05216371_7287 [Streptomyces sp. TLI_053]|nr:hypothetical protein SAMN05216371_7287 [Streptomyces sp. TLI_053]